MKTALILLLLITSLSGFAEVISSSDHNFHIRIRMEVPVAPEVAYRRFLEIDRWWDGSHTWFGDAGGLTIEPQAGGCFCERQGRQTAFHMLVTYVNPGREIRMTGGLGPLQRLGLHGGMTFLFDTIEDKSFIVHEYRVIGFVEGGLADFGKIVDQVQTGQLARLGRYITESVAAGD